MIIKNHIAIVFLLAYCWTNASYIHFLSDDSAGLKHFPWVERNLSRWAFASAENATKTALGQGDKIDFANLVKDVASDFLDKAPNLKIGSGIAVDVPLPSGQVQTIYPSLLSENPGGGFTMTFVVNDQVPINSLGDLMAYMTSQRQKALKAIKEGLLGPIKIRGPNAQKFLGNVEGKTINEIAVVTPNGQKGFTRKKLVDLADTAVDDLLRDLKNKVPANKWDDFVADFGDNAELLKTFGDRPGLVNAWKKIENLGDDAFDQLRKDLDFLKKFDDVVKNSRLNKHVLEGDISYELLETGQKKWKVGGVHHKTAFDNNTARIKSGTKSTPNTNGYYTAKVEVYHPEFPDNGGFKVKAKESTFFPEDWSVDKLRAEIAGAIKNKGAPTVYPDGRKLYKGTMTDGTELAIWEDAAGNITSTYPVL